MNFLKKYLVFILILVFGVVVRIINLDKPTGLWYDEMGLYSIASQNSLLDMINIDSHRFLMFPFYFIVYKFWILIFGNSDFTIRLMSVFFDMLAIAVAYFMGMQAAQNIGKDKHQNSLGLVTMLFYTINSSFIYYAQEAKFYSLSFLLVNLLILFWLKILRSDNKTNSILFVLINFLLLYTYTSQALLILILMGVTCVYWVSKNRFMANFKLLLGWISVFIPLILFMVFYPHYFSGNFDAVVYDNSFILLVLGNWFSPMLNALQNNILEYHKFIAMFILNSNLWLLFLVPTLISLSLIIQAAKRFNVVRYIIAVPLFYVGIHMILSEMTYYNALVRYTLVALPFAVVCMAMGLDNLKNKKVKIVLLVLILALNLGGLFCKYGAISIKRPDGYKVLAETLTANKISEKEDFILPIRTELLDKYFSVKGKKYNLYDLNSIDAQKTYLSESEIREITQKKDLHKNYQRYLSTNYVSKSFADYVEKKYIKNANTGLIVLTDKSISIFNPSELNTIVNSNAYKNYPIQFLRLSKLNNDLLLVLDQKMKLTNYIKLGSWEIFEFHKY